jgi:hypothetical protein
MKKDTYKHLGEDSHANVQIELSMEELARRICSRNYGAHRFLSALVDELRKQAGGEEIAYPSSTYGNEAKAGEQKMSEGKIASPLADGIEPLLEKYFY